MSHFYIAGKESQLQQGDLLCHMSMFVTKYLRLSQLDNNKIYKTKPLNLLGFYLLIQIRMSALL